MNSKRRPVETISDVLKSVLSEKGYLTDCLESDAMIHWEDVVGQGIAQVTMCDRIEDGTLYVRVKNSPWRQELSFMKQQIIHNIKQKTRCKTLKDIIFY